MTPELLSTLEVRCEDVHPVRCDVAFRASGDQALTDRVRAHGASAHGFTPVWYSRERIAAITEACTTSADAPRHEPPGPWSPACDDPSVSAGRHRSAAANS